MPGGTWGTKATIRWTWTANFFYTNNKRRQKKAFNYTTRQLLLLLIQLPIYYCIIISAPVGEICDNRPEKSDDHTSQKNIVNCP